MTIYVEESNNNLVEFAVNLPNLELDNHELIITSQYSHQPLILTAECILTNSRYSLFTTEFPAGFGEEHKNGIYYWDLAYLGDSLEKGLVKIITEPGGGINSLAYNAGPITDDRVSEVYFRPNY
jgi:hypothetical protein